jgi:anti-sigma B factor antagonist
MQVEERPALPDWRMLAVTGRVDALSSPDLETECLAALDRGGHLILDLGEVAYMSSAGLRALLAAQRHGASLERRVVLLSPQGLVRDVLEISGFTSIFPIVESLDEVR